MESEVVPDARISLAGSSRKRLNARPTPRRGALKPRKLQQALEDLDSLDIRVHLEVFSARRVVEFAKRYHLQGYDALYFDLGRTLGLPLATLDHGHRQAARVHNVEVFSPA